MEKLTTQKKEMARLLDEAFSLGYESATETLKQDSFDPDVLLKNFLNFLSGYRVVFTDDGVGVADRDQIFTTEYAIKLFKLKYGYDES